MAVPSFSLVQAQMPVYIPTKAGALFSISHGNQKKLPDVKPPWNLPKEELSSRHRMRKHRCRSLWWLWVVVGTNENHREGTWWENVPHLLLESQHPPLWVPVCVLVCVAWWAALLRRRSSLFCFLWCLSLFFKVSVFRCSLSPGKPSLSSNRWLFILFIFHWSSLPRSALAYFCGSVRA